MLGTAAGAGFGATLGQIAGGGIGGPLAQAIAALLGTQMPTGADALAGLGMDPESLLTHGLGMGVDIATDPLTYLGAGAGKLAGTLGKEASLGAKAAEGGGIANRLERMAGGGLDEAMKLQGASKAGIPSAVEPFMEGVDPMRQFISPESMATGATRSFKNPESGLARELEHMGLGSMNEAGDAINMNAGLKKNLSHADRRGAPGVPPAFAKPAEGRGKMNLVPSDAVEMPTSIVPNNSVPSTSEMGLLRAQSELAGPSVNSIHNPMDPFKALANERYLGEKSGGLADALGASMDPGDFPGPFSSQIPGVQQSILEKLGPSLGTAALAGGTAGAGWGLGGNKFPWERR